MELLTYANIYGFEFENQKIYLFEIICPFLRVRNFETIIDINPLKVRDIVVYFRVICKNCPL